jgi:lipoyl(octanoyl) transferase
LRYFDLIVPCGIADREPTSLEKILGRGIEPKEAAPPLIRHFGEVFGLEMKPASREELLEKLECAERPVALPV